MPYKVAIDQIPTSGYPEIDANGKCTNTGTTCMQFRNMGSMEVPGEVVKDGDNVTAVIPSGRTVPALILRSVSAGCATCINRANRQIQA